MKCLTRLLWFASGVVAAAMTILYAVLEVPTRKRLTPAAIRQRISEAKGVIAAGFFDPTPRYDRNGEERRWWR